MAGTEGWSFPSNHVLVSVVFYGILLYLLIRSIRSRRSQIWAVLGVGSLLLLIGLSDMYLQRAYLSDVVAGYAGGLLWLTICVTGLETYKRW